MLKGGYILCIDDDEDDCNLLSDSFKNLNSNIRIEFKDSGITALQFLRDAITKNELPRLIVLDLNMPGLNGRQVLEHIRSIPELTGITVLIFSTDPNDQNIIEIENSGVSIFQKPNTVSGYQDIARTIGYMMA